MAMSDYLCFHAGGSDGTITLKQNGTVSWTGSYSTDKTNWTDYTLGTVLTIPINSNVYFKGTLSGNQTSSNYLQFVMTGAWIGTSGNVMSLYFQNDFYFRTTLPSNGYTFYKLFYNCTCLYCYVDKYENYLLELPATTLADYCYAYMFDGCTSLYTAPKLPATTLGWYCYNYMFSGCTDLMECPELPATTLANSCYHSMFRGCTNLTRPIELPATTLPSRCYYRMFYNCTNIYLYEEMTGEASNPYRIPTTGEAQMDGSMSIIEMFYGTSGKVSTPRPDTTYYFYDSRAPRVVNKIKYGTTTLIDLTSDTAYKWNVRSGVTFHDSAGHLTIGTATGGASTVLSGTPGINKVIYNGETLIDLTADTITPGDVEEGYTFHACDGNQYTGTYVKS